MELTAQQVFDATPVLATIINERRPLPIKGSYRLTRLHAKLIGDFNLISARRDEIITAYGHREMVPGPLTVEDPFRQKLVPAANFSVPPDMVEDFAAKWSEIATEVLDIDVQPCPIDMLNLGDDREGSITALELIALGPLVTE